MKHLSLEVLPQKEKKKIICPQLPFSERFKK